MDLKTRSAESSSINNKAEELRVFLRELYLSWPLETNVFHVVGGRGGCKNYTEFLF